MYNMNIAVYLKNNLKNIPPSLGKIINLLPYKYRPGIGYIYNQRKNEITNFESLTQLDKENFIFERMRSIVIYAYVTVQFYKYYDKLGFNPRNLKTFKDLKSIPIINKSILRNVI